jgi:hypothetical protein
MKLRRFSKQFKRDAVRPLETSDNTGLVLGAEKFRGRVAALVIQRVWLSFTALPVSPSDSGT